MSVQWIRLYTEVLDDPKVQKLPPELFKFWVNILCLAGKNEGSIPTEDDVSFALRTDLSSVSTAFHYLEKVGLIDNNNGARIPHGWSKRQYKSDSSTDRVKRYRKRYKKRYINVTVTPPEQNRTEQNRTEYKETTKEKTKPDNEEILFDADDMGSNSKPVEKKSKPEDTEPDGFAEFWGIYPKQRAGSKQKARAAYCKAIKHATAAEIMRGATSYAKSDEVERGFAKGCAAWLNDDRWKCDYSRKSQPEQKPAKTEKYDYRNTQNPGRCY